MLAGLEAVKLKKVAQNKPEPKKENTTWTKLENLQGRLPAVANEDMMSRAAALEQQKLGRQQSGQSDAGSDRSGFTGRFAGGKLPGLFLRL